MLAVVLILTAAAAVSCDSECFLDIQRLRCWCRNQDDQTIFRITQEKDKNDVWTVKYNVTNETCAPTDISDLWPPSSGEKEESTTTEAVTTAAPEEVKRPGYVVIGDSMYKVYGYGQIFDTARRNCIGDGAHLAVINSEAEAVNVAYLLKKKKNFLKHVTDPDRAFIGFHDLYEEGEYLTLDGQPLRETGYTTWALNKPDNKPFDNDFLGFAGNDCGGLTNNGKLIDLGCDWFYAYICEIEISVPAPCGEQVDYSKGALQGIETIKAPPPGTKQRVEAAGLGYTLYPGFGLYRYYTTVRVWDNARRVCEADGAHLALLDSLQELQLLSNIINKVPQQFIIGAYSNRYTFVGYHSLYDYREFVTLYNVTLEEAWPYNVTTNNWWTTFKYAGEMCMSINSKNALDDIDCHMQNAFICEKDVMEG